MVTPWLRTSQSKPVRLFADSGRQDRGDTVRVERNEVGRWVRLPEDSDRALGFAAGTRAVVDRRLYRETGPPIALDCEGELRATPDGSELVCIEIVGRFGAGGAPQTVRITRLDRDGQVIDRRDLPLPVRVADDEPPLGGDVSTAFLGFLPEGLVFSVLPWTAHESFASGTPKRARAFLLHADSRWSELGTLTFTVDDLWTLRFPHPWNEALGWHIAEGERLRNSLGEPRPS
jgi:hypothetical protein